MSRNLSDIKTAQPSPERERILFAAHEFTRGGASYLALRHIRRLASRYEIDLLITGRWEEEMLSQLPQDIVVFKLEAHTLQSEVDALSLEFFLKHRGSPPFQRTYLAALGTSVVPLWHACMAMGMARAKKKMVFLVDERLAVYPQLTPQEQSIIDVCLHSADLVVPVSRRLWQRVAERCPALAQRPWQALRPPVDVDKILSQSAGAGPDWGARDEPVVLSVCRLTPDKQIMQCLHIHHQLRQSGVEFRWVVVGVGHEEQALRAEIDRLGMEDAFLLAGSQENIYAWMKACDLFALLSSSEGCPTVVIEALLAGCPVIMTDVNGSDELIDNGRTGMIVSNDAQSIATGLSRLVQDAGLRDRFRRNLAGAPAITDAARETEWLMSKIEETKPEPVFVPGTPKVTILIPTYNHAHCIHRAIASAMMQDFPSLEVIVIDDASTDGAGRVASAWVSDPRFRYVRNAHNLGRNENYRQALAEHARGEWVLMLDGDDYLIDPGFIRHAWDSLQRHAGQSVVFAQAGHRIHHLPGGRKDAEITPPIDGAERMMAGGEYLRFVFETGFFTHLGSLYNRKAAIETGFYTADIASSDMDSLLRLSLEGNVLLLNTVAGCWVQHNENTSSNVSFEKIPANVLIFREITAMAILRGHTSLPEIGRALKKFEGRVLMHLLDRTIGKTLQGPFAILEMLRLVISINPRLLLSRRMRTFLRESFQKLANPDVETADAGHPADPGTSK